VIAGVNRTMVGSDHFGIFDSEFELILGSNLELVQIADGLAFTEGDFWIPRLNKVIVSDIPNSRIVSWSESDGFGIYRKPSGRSNGNTIDREGRVVTCLTQGRSVVREELDGSMTTLAKYYKGGKLTSPNDVVVKSDGRYGLPTPITAFSTQP